MLIRRVLHSIFGSGCLPEGPTLTFSAFRQVGMDWYLQCQLVRNVLTFANHAKKQAGSVALCASRVGAKVPRCTQVVRERLHKKTFRKCPS